MLAGAAESGGGFVNGQYAAAADGRREEPLVYGADEIVRAAGGEAIVLDAGGTDDAVDVAFAFEFGGFVDGESEESAFVDQVADMLIGAAKLLGGFLDVKQGIGVRETLEIEFGLDGSRQRAVASHVPARQGAHERGALQFVMEGGAIHWGMTK